MNIKRFRCHAWPWVACGLLFAHLPTAAAATDVPPGALRKLVQLKGSGSGLCARRDDPAVGLSFTIQRCDAGDARQWFFIFEEALDATPTAIHLDRVRLVPAWNFITRLTADAILGNTWGDATLKQGFHQRAGVTMRQAMDATVAWRVTWNAADPERTYFRNGASGYCLSYAGHQPYAGTSLAVGTCDPNLDGWYVLPIIPTTP